MGAKVSSGGGNKRGSYSANSEPNIIPFIDILLVLLIIFMVAAPIPTTDVKVDLPPPVPPKDLPEKVKPKRPTIVDIRDDQSGIPQIFVDGQLTEEADLADRVLAQVSINVPDSPNRLLETVRVRADQSLPYAVVMEAMAKLQEADFQKVSLVAEEALPEDQVQ